MVDIAARRFAAKAATLPLTLILGLLRLIRP